MRYIFKITVIAFVLASCHNNHVNKEIKDNGQALTIKVDVQTDTQRIYYKQDFDVNGMNALQKKALVDHIYDSLGVK